jgi:hypothetical protein
VSTAAGFKPAERLQLTGARRGGAAAAAQLARDYLGATRPSRYQETQLWTQMHEYWRQAGLAWARSVDGFLQANVRGAWRPPAVRAAARWRNRSSGSTCATADRFQGLGRDHNVFAAAEARGVADARSEFLKAAMFSASSDGLLPPRSSSPRSW